MPLGIYLFIHVIRQGKKYKTQWESLNIKIVKYFKISNFESPHL